MDTGRVFFFPSSKQVRTVRAVTLESHMENVKRLAIAWQPEKAYLQLPPTLRGKFSHTQEKLIRSAQRHDEGKRYRFRITKNNGEFVYSYRGHRFDVTDPDLYVELLIRLHHNAYSVSEINDAISRLRLEPNLSEFAELFPFDAYALQMCDQIIAEIEIFALDNKNPRKPEFMEFKTEKRPDGKIAIDPFPFMAEEIVLFVDYADIGLRAEEAQGEAMMTKRVKDENPQIHSVEVTLCRLV